VRVNRVLGSSGVWRECARNKGASSASLATFKMAKGALCAQKRCLDARNALAQRIAHSAPIVSCKLILLKGVVNATKQHHQT